jgi:regulator of replication initiation timing
LLSYVRINLGDKRPGVAEIEAMKSDLESALARIQSLEAENEKLKNKLNQMEGNEGVEPPVINLFKYQQI